MEKALLNQSLAPLVSPQQAEANADLFRNILVERIKAIPIGICPIDELGLIYNKDDQEDLNELRDILTKRLSYPSSDIAYLHMKANQLGTLDLPQENQNFNEQRFKQISENANICPCCGFILQQSNLTLGTSIADINHIGVSTYLYFITLKHLIGLLCVMLCVFSIYAVVSNIVASNIYRKSLQNIQVLPVWNSYESFLVVSLGSKQLHGSADDKKSFEIQCWLGVAMIALWGILFGWIKQRERKNSVYIDIESRTASDYAILIQNFPKNLTLKEFQSQLNEYQKNCEGINHQGQTPIAVSQINMVTPFYLDKSSFSDDEIEEINQKYEAFQNKFIEWIQQRMISPHFLSQKQQRNQIYQNFQKLKNEKVAIYERFAQKIKKKWLQKQDFETVPAFVTFHSTYNKKFLLNMHDEQNWLLRKILCMNNSNHFHFKHQQNQYQVHAQIRQASEPEDINWRNMGQEWSSLFLKKILTYTIAIIVLGGSFGAIYGLSKVQFDYSKVHDDISNQYISALISLCISIINIIIQQILRFLTKLERNQTYIHEQSSLGIKAVFALLINSILIPILVNYFFKGNLYGINGLAYDVFYLGITNSFLSPFLKTIDLYYYFTRFLRWYKDKPKNKLSQNQNQLNATYEYMDFEIGYEYIYMVNLFLFTCFFSPLQPIIVVFAIVGFAWMYWAQKYSLFNRCKRPTPGNNTINTTMYQLIYLGPAFYTIGSFCWSNFFQSNWIGIAPNLAAAILSGIIFLLPYKSIVKKIFEEQYEQERFYQKDRIFLPSEYNRLNPATSEEGVKQYMNYLADFKKNMQYKTPEEIKSLQHQFLRQFGMGARKNQAVLPTIFNYLTFNKSANYNEDQLLLQKLLGMNKNFMTPFLVGNTVLYQGDKRSNKNIMNPLNMVVQNWQTNQEQQVTYQKEKGHERKKSSPRGGPKGHDRPGAGGERTRQTKNTFKMTQSHFHGPKQPQGQQVEYKFNNDTQPLEINKNGINLLYSSIVNHIDKSQGNQKQNTNQIPLNVPVNIFTGLLQMSEKKNQHHIIQENKQTLFDSKSNSYLMRNQYNKKGDLNSNLYPISINLFHNLTDNSSSKQINHQNQQKK